MPSARPDLDPELRTLLADLPLRSDLDLEALAQLRPFSVGPIEALLDGRPVDRRELTVPAPDGTRIPLSIFTPARAESSTAAPCVFWIHGGGMVMGDRFSQIDIPFDWLDAFGAVVVTVDHRLAPEATGTTLVDDCYRSLAWVAAHADEPGIDPAVWTRERNEFGWRSVLGDLAAGEVPGYVSPGGGRRPVRPADHLPRRRRRRGLPRRGRRVRRPDLGGRRADGTAHLGRWLPRVRRAVPERTDLGRGTPHAHGVARPDPRADGGRTSRWCAEDRAMMRQLWTRRVDSATERMYALPAVKGR